MYQADLQPCTYLPIEKTDRLIGVGWLDRESKFESGSIDKAIFERLVELSRDPWQPFVAGGAHPCNLCQFHSEASSGTNLFIPGEGVLYVAPALITHYINAHYYLPPSIFCGAVLACPDMRTPEYRQAVAKCKVSFRFPNLYRTK